MLWSPNNQLRSDFVHITFSYWSALQPAPIYKLNCTGSRPRYSPYRTTRFRDSFFLSIGTLGPWTSPHYPLCFCLELSPSILFDKNRQLMTSISEASTRASELSHPRVADTVHGTEPLSSPHHRLNLTRFMVILFMVRNQDWAWHSIYSYGVFYTSS